MIISYEIIIISVLQMLGGKSQHCKLFDWICFGWDMESIGSNTEPVTRSFISPLFLYKIYYHSIIILLGEREIYLIEIKLVIFKNL